MSAMRENLLVLHPRPRGGLRASPEAADRALAEKKTSWQ